MIRLLPLDSPVLFGRNDELDELLSSISDCSSPNPARIAILGTGGIGKSSLAMATLLHERVAVAFGAYRFFVACDSAESANGIINEMAARFQISGDRLRKRVLSALSRVKALVVLDNFETPWAAPGHRAEVEELLSEVAQLPNITLLVTMRGTERPLGTRWTTPLFKPLQPLTSDAAIQAFLARSRLVDDTPEMRELLDALEGLPLAITLVAEMARTEAPSELLRRWRTQSTSMVHSSTSNRRTCLETSISLSLNTSRMRQSPDALRLLSLLSVLPAGLPAQFSHPSFPTLGKCTAVLKSSALAYSTEGERLRVLSPIRAYVSRHHPPPIELIAPLEHMCMTVAGLCQQVGLTHETAQILPRIAAEAANVESLCCYILENVPDAGAEWLVPVICEFDKFLTYTGLPSGTLLDRAAAIATTPRQQLQLLMRRVLHRNTPDEEALLCREALEVARSVGDVAYEAEALLRLGITRNGQPDTMTLRRQALQLYEALGDAHMSDQGFCLFYMGSSALYFDDYAGACAFLEEAIRRLDLCGAFHRAMRARRLLADVFVRQGEFGKAADINDHCMEQARLLDDTGGLADAIIRRGGLATALGDVDKAIESYEAAIGLLSRRGAKSDLAHVQLNLVGSLISRGDLLAARDTYESALPSLRSSWEILSGHCIAAELAGAEGNLEDSRAHALTARRLARARNATRMEALVYATLGDAAFASEDPLQHGATTYVVLSLAMLGRVGNVLYLMECIPRVGKLMHLLADYSTSREIYHWGLDWSRRSGMKAVQARCLIGLAELEDASGAAYVTAWTVALHASRLAGEQRMATECEGRLESLSS